MSWKPRRRTVWTVVFLMAAGGAGYLSTLVLYPAQIVPERHEVPALRGLTVLEANARLAALSLRGRLADSVADGEAPVGTIAWQSPASGTSLPVSALVRFAVSLGPARLVVPDLEGFEVTLADEVLRAAGLRLGSVDTVRGRAESGTIVRTTPPIGATTRLGQAIDVSVSQGVAAIAMPSVVGMTLDAARDRLALLGLTVGTVRQTLDGVPGTVQGQSPAVGTLLTKGQSITLSVSGVME